MTRLQISLALILALAAPAAGQDRSADENWRRVSRLDAGEPILVTTRDVRSADRLFVSADGAGVTTLNLTDPSVPDEAARELRHVAEQHPEYLDGARAGRGFKWNNVRVLSDGVFVGDRKVAELQQVLETPSRSEVAEVARLRRGRGFWGHAGLLGGYFVGAMGAVVVMGFACQAIRCENPDSAGMVALLTGGIAGGAYGAYAARRETEEVVYRKP
jgi:hypothetical protein